MQAAQKLEDEHADWIAAYDAFDPKQLPPYPKRDDELFVHTRFDGDVLAVAYERCAQCKQLGLVGAWDGVMPYYIKAAGPGKPGQRKVVIRWLHRGECSDEWHARYRAWMDGEQT